LEGFSFIGIRSTHIFNNNRVRVLRGPKHVKNYVRIMMWNNCQFKVS
jgi:hypothetical protein